jgi:hypothetical protein
MVPSQNEPVPGRFVRCSNSFPLRVSAVPFCGSIQSNFQSGSSAELKYTAGTGTFNKRKYKQS